MGALRAQELAAEWAPITEARERDKREAQEAEREAQRRRAEEIERICRERRIRKLVHFTHVENVAPIMRYGLLSKTTLKHERVDFRENDPERWDRHEDALCMSIEFPNHKMMYKLYSARVPLVVLEIRPEVLWTKRCAFYFTNAAANAVRFSRVPEMEAPEALLDMFYGPDDVLRRAPEDYRRYARGGLSPQFPTDPQAEVLVFDRVEPAMIVSINFPSLAALNDFVGGGHSSVPLAVAPQYFAAREGVRHG